MNPDDLAALRTRLPQGVLLEVAPVADHMQDLHAEEREAVASAVATRQQEYSSARHLAHRMLQELVGYAGPIPIAEDRSPVWPSGVLGSLSHSRTWCAASVAREGSGLLGIGVDIEDLRPMAPGILDEVLTPRERQALPLDDPDGLALATFSIKEAVYKCLQPVGNRGMGFQAMELDFTRDPTRPQLTALEGLRKRLPPGVGLPEVHLLRQNGLLLSYALLQAPPGPAP